MANAEIIRSTFLNENHLKGTKLFCTFSNGWFDIHTRWESFKRFRGIYKALDYFERFAEGGC